MKDSDYVKLMIELIDELYHHSSAELFDPVGFHELVCRFRAKHSTLLQRHRRRSWFALFFCLAMLAVLLLIVYWILSLLWMRGTI